MKLKGQTGRDLTGPLKAQPLIQKEDVQSQGIHPLTVSILQLKNQPATT